MNKIIQLVLISLLPLSYSELSPFITEGDITIEKQQKLLNERITQNCTLTSASKELQKIATYIEGIDYSYSSTIEKKDFLKFEYIEWKNYKVVESIVYENCNYAEYFFKKKTPLKGNYYPKFRIIEFCFNSHEKASEYYKKITHILRNQEKNYGYLLLNNDRLIHVQTGVNMYSFIINDLKKDFEKIIKKGQ